MYMYTCILDSHIVRHDQVTHAHMCQERQKYVGLGECCERLQTQTRNVNTSGIAARLKLSRVRKVYTVHVYT